MSFFAISGLLNGIAAISLAILVYTRSPRDPRHWSYGLLGLSIAIWSFSYFFWQLAESREEALLLCRLLMAGAIFIPITQLHHVLYLTNDSIRLRTVIKSTYYVAGFFLLVDATPYFVADVQPTNHFPFWPQPGPLFHVFLVWWSMVALYSCYLLALACQREKGMREKQFLYLLIASAVGYVGGATNFPLWYGIEILPYGTICFTFYVALIAYTLLRYRLMDFSVIVEKGLSYLAVLLLISQPAYPVLLLAQKSVFGAISYRYSMVQLFVHILTVAGAYQMRLGSRGGLSRSLLGGEDSTLKALSQFSTNISAFQDMPQLGKEIVTTLRKGMDAQVSLLFVLNGDKKSYVPVSGFGTLQHAQAPASSAFAVTDDLPRYLAIVQSRVIRHELKQSFPDQWKLAVIKDLERLQADVCFPFIRKNHLLGFCLIGPCRQDSIEAADALGFISTLLGEASLALENVLLREEIQRSKDVVRQMDRLRSLETMSAGLAQELDHPQASIKAFVQLARMRKNDEEFLRRFQSVISSDVQRIEQLTKDIREYVSEASLDSRSDENINDLLESCVRFILLNPQYQHVTIEKALSSECPIFSCKRQEMRQAIFNVLLYHLHLEEHREKTLFLKTQVIKGATGESWMQVEFWDREEVGAVDVLLPSFITEKRNLIEINKADLYDEGLDISADIIGTYGGYIQAYSSANEPVLLVISLPVKTEESVSNAIDGQSLDVPLLPTQ